MGEKKNSSYKPKTFESMGQYTDSTGKKRNDFSANIFYSMLTSKAFTTLNAKQKTLYLYCKMQFYGNEKPRYDKKFKDFNLFTENDYFFMNIEKAEQYGLYAKDTRHLYRDIQVLINHGLIEKVSQGGGRTRRKTVYKYSDKWQQWEEPEKTGEGKKKK